MSRVSGSIPIGTAAAGPAVAAVVVFLVATLLGSASRAQHCGSYVNWPNEDALADVLGLSFDPLTDLPSVPWPAPTLPDRCEGPGCSKAPAAPWSNPSRTESPPVEHWAIAPVRGRDADALAARRPRSEDRPRLDPPLGGVFHPPRPRR